MENLVVKYASLEDINDIYTCNKKCLPIFYSKTELRFLLMNSDIVILTIKHLNKFIGYLVFEIQNKNAHIMSIAIYPEYRSKGIGSHLMKCFFIVCSKRNILSSSLFVHVENMKGIKFYKKNGFRKNKTIKNYYISALKNCLNYDAYKMIKKIKY